MGVCACTRGTGMRYARVFVGGARACVWAGLPGFHKNMGDKFMDMNINTALYAQLASHTVQSSQ